VRRGYEPRLESLGNRGPKAPVIVGTKGFRSLPHPQRYTAAPGDFVGERLRPVPGTSRLKRGVPRSGLWSKEWESPRSGVRYASGTGSERAKVANVAEWNPPRAFAPPVCGDTPTGDIPDSSPECGRGVSPHTRNVPGESAKGVALCGSRILSVIWNPWRPTGRPPSRGSSSLRWIARTRRRRSGQHWGGSPGWAT